MTKINAPSAYDHSPTNRECLTDFTLVSQPQLVKPSAAPYKKLLRKLDLLSATMANIRKTLAAEAGLSYPQLNILLTLAESPRTEGINVRSLASMLDVTGAFITVEVNKLVEAGYIRKTPNPSDKRSIHLQLTDQGWYFVADIMPIMEGYHDKVFGHISMNELSTAHQLVNSLLSEGKSLLVDLHAHRDQGQRKQ